MIAEARLVLHLLRALVDDQNLLDVGQDILVFREDTRIVQAEVGLVHRRDFQGDLACFAGRFRCLPLRGFEKQPLSGGRKVEPVPAAVAKGFKRQLEDGRCFPFDVAAVDALNGATGV